MKSYPFSPPRIVAEDLEDLSLYSLEPYYHVKVYQLDTEVDLNQPGLRSPMRSKSSTNL